MRREAFVARSRAEARRLCEPFLAAKYEAYRRWGQDRAMPEGDIDFERGFEELTRDRFMLGSPEEVAAQLLRLHEQTGANHFILSLQQPGMPQPQVLEAMRMLAGEVMPAVRQG
jgi:alkanesulfonate monooxygenase SsuD/methylene tetrahydromethanopterin reductase-like flavin-dependent oxidoreductase (luciferase family)